MSRPRPLCASRGSMRLDEPISLLCILIFISVIREYGSELTDAQTLYIRQGDDLKITCDFNTTGNITLVVWKLKNSPVKSINPLNGDLSNDNLNLYLKNVSLANSGIYTCIGYSLEVPYLNHSKEVIVQVIPQTPRNHTLLPSSSTSLTAFWIPSNANESVVLYSLYLYQKDKLTVTRNVTAPHRQFTFRTLSPYMCYTLFIRSLNNVGWSELSGPAHAMTLPGRPFIRPSVNVLNVNQTHVSVMADHTKLILPINQSAPSSCNTGDALFSSLQGPLSHYAVTVTTIGKARNTPPAAKSIHLITNTSKQVMVIGPLQPYTQYRLSFAFVNKHFNGPITHLNVTTLEGLPDPPVSLNGRASDDSVTLTWSDGRANGQITGYKVELYRCTGETAMNTPNTSLRLRQSQIGPTRQRYTFDNLDANTCFAARVAATTRVGLGNFSSLHQLYTDLPAPSPPSLMSVTFTKSSNVLVNWTCSRPDCTALAPPPPPPSLVGIVGYYSVCWSLPPEKVVPNDQHPEDSTCLTVPSSSSDSSKSATACTCATATKAYQTLTLPWHLIQNSRSGMAVFSVRSGIKREVCCYDGCTSTRCRKESIHSNIIPIGLADAPAYWKPAYFQLDSATVGGISAVVCLVFLFVLFITCFPSRQRFSSHPCWHSLVICRRSAKTDNSLYFPADRSGKPVSLRLNRSAYNPIPRDSLCSYVANLHANDDAGFQAEFEAIDRSTSLDLTTHTARLSENVMKNRYSNVLAYDHSRVVLQDSGCKTDYINANFVDGYFRQAAYIATQGPIPSTFDDFWLMVWEQDCNVIVMISNFIERSRRKCDQYWPTGGSQVYGTISVRMISESVRAFFTTRLFGIRHIKCKRSSKERVVFHYQYTDWRDFDVPSTALPVLKFIETSVLHWTVENGPIVVHCSAGVGRTGTYICIDSLIRQLKVEKCASVRGFLEHIRQQRMKLVQTEQQYAFIYDALSEYVLNPCNKITPKLLSYHIEHLRALDSSGQSNLEKLFTMCVGYDSRNTEFSSSRTLGGTPAPKNSSTTVNTSSGNWWWTSNLPAAHRPSPTMLPGHYSLCEYHIAKHPVSETQTANFWRMVWEDNSPLIICLLTIGSDGGPSVHLDHSDGSGDDADGLQCQKQTSGIFWPTQAQQSVSVDWLQVTFVESNELSPWLSRFQFLLTSDREDYALSCTLWSFSAWPSEDSGTKSLDSQQVSFGGELLQMVNRCGTGAGTPGTHDFFDDEDTPISGGTVSGQRESAGPTVVVDDSDGRRAGIFCALRIAINQLLDEGYSDIYFIFKMICQQQPGIFQSYHDLELVYTLLQQYIIHHLHSSQVSSNVTSNGAPSHQPHSAGGLAHLLGLPVKNQSVSHRSPVRSPSVKPFPRRSAHQDGILFSQGDSEFGRLRKIDITTHKNGKDHFPCASSVSQNSSSSGAEATDNIPTHHCLPCSHSSQHSSRYSLLRSQPSFNGSVIDGNPDADVIGGDLLNSVDPDGKAASVTSSQPPGLSQHQPTRFGCSTGTDYPTERDELMATVDGSRGECYV